MATPITEKFIQKLRIYLFYYFNSEQNEFLRYSFPHKKLVFNLEQFSTQFKPIDCFFLK